jgi:hypothetical protein
MGGMARGLNWKAGLTGAGSTLSRPIGATEMELTGENGWHAFPPRAPEQPFFRPVLNKEHRIRSHATEIRAAGELAM